MHFTNSQLIPTEWFCWHLTNTYVWLQLMNNHNPNMNAGYFCLMTETDMKQQQCVLELHLFIGDTVTSLLSHIKGFDYKKNISPTFCAFTM